MSRTRRRLLEALEEGPVTGPELADRLDVSRAAVWKHVESLRAEGVDVESTDDGYAVTGVPEFGRAAVEFGLTAPFAVEYHDSIPSTNDRARELAVEGASDVAVVADEQTGGRGRLERAWTSPSGGIWCSLALRPERPAAHAPAFTLAAAVAVTRVGRGAGVDAVIKWPNDVLVADDERKLAGVLTEMEGEADRISWLVAGVGINANVDASSLPETATSLRSQLGRDVDRGEFLRNVLEEFVAIRRDLETVVTAWREHSNTLGRRVRVETPGGAVEGEAVDIQFPGALVVRTGDGTRTVHAGDCQHLRPAE